MKKLTKKQIEKLAVEIRKFLLDNRLWVDVRIYFNGKAFSTDDGKGNYYYNDPEHLIVLDDEDPRNYFKYVGDILSMSFEGDFYGVMNCTGEYGYKFDDRIREGFDSILEKYGVFAELGNAWNLSLYYR